MGYGMCSTGQHFAWVSAGGFRSFKCECPPMKPYIVGERGPETFRIEKGGVVTPIHPSKPK